MSSFNPKAYLKNKAVPFFHNVMLIAMLHSTFVAPAQGIAMAWLQQEEGYHYQGFRTLTSSPEESRPQVAATPAKMTAPPVGIRNLTSLLSVPGKRVIFPDIKEGVIGISAAMPLDDAADNIFKFQLEEALQPGDKVTLSYELFGVQGHNAVSRSINERPAIGGYMASVRPGWSVQQEELAADWLKRGDNHILFTAPEHMQLQYHIRNLKIAIENNGAASAPQLVVRDHEITEVRNGKVYLSGFVRGRHEGLKVMVGETELKTTAGEFEGFVTLDNAASSRKFLSIKAWDDKGLLGQDVIWLAEKPLEAERSILPEALHLNTAQWFTAAAGGSAELDKASIKAGAGAVTQDKVISIAQMRSVDIPPMPSGVINVTKGKGAYRFLPDGTKFEKEVQISIPYDSILMPAGSNPSDIKTYFFNIRTKSWVAVKKDTLNLKAHTVTSFTNHFTDYINGIIQAPDSPQSNMALPTAMSDVKAANPAAEMTLISPPGASQKGDASVSYPIKLPAGRQGVQPSLALQYSNYGSDNDLGEGWNLNIPAINIDTRWGAPEFSATENSEIYLLNGEQMMYPQYEGKDWMPNRHREIGSDNLPDVTRMPRSNGTPVVFSMRKQGSMTRIERLGNNTTDYYWKVTGSDGTVYWYGKKTGSANEAVLRDGTGNTGNIVHWALSMVEDVHGNNVIYEYYGSDNAALTSSDPTINGGKNLRIKAIHYTGANDQQGNYHVGFVYDDNVRKDVLVNAKLGVKIVNPFRLTNINVRYVSDTIRSYNLGYKEGRFSKSLLDYVAEIGQDNTEFYRHTFEYYDDVKQGDTEVYFDAGVDIDMCYDGPAQQIDTDHDGVPDSSDGCITVPGPVSNGGCPVGEATPCYSTTFRKPASSMYSYAPKTIDHIGMVNANVPFTDCFVSTDRLLSINIDGVNHSPATNNIFLIHGAGNNALASRCPSYPLTSIPDPITKNPDYEQRARDFIHDSYYNDGHSIYNVDMLSIANSYLIQQSSTSHAINSSMHYYSFYSSDVMTTKFTRQAYCPDIYAGSPYTITNDVEIGRSTNPLSVTLITKVYINNATTELGTYNLSIGAQYNQFVSDLTALFPGIVITTTGTSPNQQIGITTQNPNLHTIKLVHTFNNSTNTDSATYTFTNCGVSRQSVAIIDDWKNVRPSEEEATYSINKWQAEGGLETLPEPDFKITTPMSYTVGEKQNTAVFLLAQNNQGDTWTSGDGIKLSDESLISSLNAKKGNDIRRQYLLQRDAFIAERKEWKEKTRRESIAWLRDYDLKHIPAASTAIPVALSKKETARTGGFTYHNYFQQLQDGYISGFTANTQVGDPNCPSFLNLDFGILGVIPHFDSSAGYLGSSKSTTYTLGGYVGVGIGWSPISKNTTFGLGYSKGWSESNSLTSMIDINGDGLEDVVMQLGDNVYYKAHSVTRGYNTAGQATVTHAFGPLKMITGIHEFFHQTGSFSSFNYQFSSSVFAGRDSSTSKSKTDVYFTDANSDGLTDIVRGSKVYFNRLDANGNPDFIADSQGTPNLVITAKAIEIDTPAEYLEEDIAPPLQDVVKVWEAPADGTIKITNDIHLGDNTKTAQVSIEMVKQPTNASCYTAMVCVPHSLITNPIYNYTAELGSVNLTGCGLYPAKVLNFTLNNITHTAPSNLFFMQYQGGVPHDYCNGNVLTDLSDPSAVSSATTWLQAELAPFFNSVNGSTMSVSTNAKYYPTNYAISPSLAGQTSGSVGFSFFSNSLITQFSANSVFDPAPPAATNPFTVYSLMYSRLVAGTNIGPIFINNQNIGNFNMPFFDVTSFQNAVQSFVGGTVSANIYLGNIPVSQNNTGQTCVSIQVDNPTQALSSITVNGQSFPFTACSSGSTTNSGDLCLLYGTTLTATNAQVNQVIDHGSASCNNAANILTVKKGDRLYFRVHSNATGNSPVDWDPRVEYTDAIANQTDMNGEQLYKSNYSNGFMLSGEHAEVFNGNGSAAISWAPVTVSSPTDEVTFEITRKLVTAPNDGDESAYNTTPELVMYRQVCPAGTTTIVSPYNNQISGIDMNNAVVSGTQMNNNGNSTMTMFNFRVKSNSNVNWKNIEWKPKMTCTTQQQVLDQNLSVGTVSSTEVKFPIPNYTIFKSYPASPAYNLADMSQFYNGDDLSFRVNPDCEVFSNSSDVINLWLVVKSNGVVIGKKHILQKAKDESGNYHSGLDILPNNSRIDIPASATMVEFGVYSDDSVLLDDQVSILQKLVSPAHPFVQIYTGSDTHTTLPNENVNLYQRPNPKFGPMYRQWGQFMYAPSAVTGALPLGNGLTGFLIKESALAYTQAMATDIQNTVNANPDNYGSSNIAADDDDTSSDSFETAIQQFQQAHPTLNLALTPASARRNFYDGNYDERWIGLHLESYASQFAYRAETFNKSFEGFTDADSGSQQAVLFTGAHAISKYGKNGGRNISAGVSLDFPASGFGVSVSGSKSKGSYTADLSDYVDINGDGYPDVVSKNEVQYTTMTGGLYAKTPRHTNIAGDTGKSESKGWGVAASGSFYKAVEEAKGGKALTLSNIIAAIKGGGVHIGNRMADNTPGSSSAGISAEYSKSKDNATVLWADINGDGLPDLLKKNGNDVNAFLNYGDNNFPTPQQVPWGQFTLNSGNGSGYGGGIGYNFKNGSIEAGASIGRSENNTDVTLSDINGDGLNDLVYSDNSNGLSVKINQGNHFETAKPWSSFNLKDSGEAVKYSINGAYTWANVIPLYVGVFIIPLKIPAITVSGSVATNTSKTKKSIADFDGDGYPDIVEEISSNKLRVQSSRIRRTNMLKTVHNPIGGSFTIDYSVDPVSYDNPYAKWVMSEVTTDDGVDMADDGVDAYTVKYKYELAHYDRREREFYGFAKVTTEDYKDDGTLYRTEVSEYNNTSYFLNGLQLQSYTTKGGDLSQLFSSSSNFYEIKKLNADRTIDIASPSEADTYDIGGSEGRRTAAVLLTRTESSIYELGSTPITTQSTMGYDLYGRVTTFQDAGNESDPSDDYKAAIQYNSTAALIAKNILTVPDVITINGVTPGTLYRKRSTSNVDAFGQIGKVSAYYNNNDTLDTTMTYNNDGTLAKIVYPSGMSYLYTYDVEGKYVIQVKDAFGYTSNSSYNYFFDKPLQTIDIAEQVTYYSYDEFGRTTDIYAPKEVALTGSPQQYTLHFSYYSKLDDAKDIDCLSDKNFVPFAVTNHYDSEHTKNDIQTITFIDGLGRAVQVKKDIEVNIESYDAPDYVEKMSVSGAATYDEFGRVVQQFHPTMEDKTCINYILNQNGSTISSSSEYDEANRVLLATDPAGNTASMSVVVDGDYVVTTTTVDNDANQVISKTYKDITGKTIKTANDNQGTSLETHFGYDPVGQLLYYKDAANLQTNYTYDMLGRKLTLQHPDNGLTTYTYNSDGNLEFVKTANLAAQNKFITYKYTYNRLDEIIYPQMPYGANISNVTYTYGDYAGDPLSRGRVTEVHDATGSQFFSYGLMGEVIYTYRKVISPTPGVPDRGFETNYAYDSWNRLLFISYPDGDDITYNYNLGGDLNKISGVINNQPYSYVQRIDYDLYEQRQYMKYGNNTETFYTYSDDLRRMTNLNVKAANGQYLFENTYDYDKVGNVTQLTNQDGANMTIGGKYSHSYGYDNLNRLKTAAGEFTGDGIQQGYGNDSQSIYSLDMQYNAFHGIVNKSQYHEKNGVPYDGNTYDNGYAYYTNTHKLESTTDSNTGSIQHFVYDLNGNTKLREVTSGSSYIPTQYYWDEEDRLRVAVKGNETMQHFIYDASGERILKASSAATSIYVNGTIDNSVAVTFNAYTTYPSALLTIDVNGKYTKHYFAGSQRIVSRIGEGSATQFDITAARPGAKEDGKEKERSGRLKRMQVEDLKFYLAKQKISNVKFRQAETDVARASGSELNPCDAYPVGSRKYVDCCELYPWACGNQITPQAIYYFHPDHLGTATYLTDMNGNPYSFFMNLPFGETMAEQKSIVDDFATPYKFTGKELDDETGLYYFGARYYNPVTSVWMSTDPLMEDYPGVSPYVYCMGNPVNFVDPDGRSVDNEYDWDVNKGTYKKVSNKGGDKTDYINIIVGGKKQYTDVVNVRQTFLNVQTNDEIVWQKSLTIRTPGRKHTTYFKPKSGALEDPSAEIFGAYAGGEIIGLAIGTAWKGLTSFSAGGKHVFWSGGRGEASYAAESFAASTGSKTLEMTWQGKALTKLTKATSFKVTKPLWQRASAAFARGAEGPVNVFQSASDGVRLESVWTKFEYPILNEKNEIIYHNVFKK